MKKLIIVPAVLAAVITCIVPAFPGASGLPGASGIAHAQDDWKKEFEELCAKSQDSAGIPPDELQRIFDRFHQTESAQTRKAEGFGLGLYITKRLVEAMGGWIDVDSVVGRGSVFAVTLPAERHLPAPATPSGATRPDRTAS